MLGLNELELKNYIKMMERLKIVILVMDDYTTKKYKIFEVKDDIIENWGIFGFAISSDTAYFWLKNNDIYLLEEMREEEFKKLCDVFLHHELSALKLKELIL